MSDLGNYPPVIKEDKFKLLKDIGMWVLIAVVVILGMIVLGIRIWMINH